MSLLDQFERYLLKQCKEGYLSSTYLYCLHTHAQKTYEDRSKPDLLLEEWFVRPHNMLHEDYKRLIENFLEESGYLRSYSENMLVTYNGSKEPFYVHLIEPAFKIMWRL